MQNEIILYHLNETNIQLEVRVAKETVWLNQSQMADLFGTKRQAITKHIKNTYETAELLREGTCSILELVQKEGNRNVLRKIEFYNLDVIISVGYRVNTQRGIQFRRWATAILKDYLLRGYAVNQRLNLLEDKIDRRFAEQDLRLNEQQKSIDFILKTEIRPTQGVFFQGQIFDAYALFEKIIGEIKNEIVLIDNYVDLSVLERFAKKKNGIKITIFTNPKTAISPLDVEKFNAQYGGLELKFTEKVHDRFLILDKNEIFHLGASLKDLGKKCFAFSLMEKNWITKILQEL